MLSGSYKDCREFHLGGDLLIIYLVIGEEVTLCDSVHIRSSLSEISIHPSTPIFSRFKALRPNRSKSSI